MVWNIIFIQQQLGTMDGVGALAQGVKRCLSAAFVALVARSPGSCHFLCARMLLARHTLCFQCCPTLMSSKANVFPMALRLMPWSWPPQLLDRMFPAEGCQCQWSRSVSSVSRSSQNTNGTDATMSDPASWSGASDTCPFQSGSDVEMSDLEEGVITGGTVMTGDESNEALPLSQLQHASPVRKTR